MQHMIEQLQPRAAAVRTTKGGPAQPMRVTNLHRFLPYYFRLASKAVEKVTGVCVYQPRAARRVPASAGFRLAALRTVVGEDARLLRLRALFKPADLDRLLADAGRAEAGRGRLFGRIRTVEAALLAIGVEVDRGGRS